MKFYTIIFSLFLILSVTFAQDYKKVKIIIESEEDLQELMTFGLEFDHPSISEDKGIEVFLSEKDFSILQSSNFNYEILIDDWMEYYNNLPKLSSAEKEEFIHQSKMNFGVTGFDYGSMGGFYTYQEIIEDLDSMFAQYPNIITEKFSIGTSHEGRTIWAVKISDNPNISENEPQVGFDALIHAREPASMATLIYFMWYMLENYGTDPEVTYLVNNREIYCIPCFNVDGYEYNRINNPNGGGMWRKNRRNNGSCYGVDLNRNYSYKWGYDDQGSSPYPCDNTYRGPSPISEPETQAVTGLITSKQINTYFNMHAYGNYFLYPWGYINQACPEEDIYIDFCVDMEQENGFEWGTGGQLLGYNSNGSARDWLYGEQVVKNRIFGYTMEIGTSSDGFWPSQSRIFPIVQNSLGALIYNTWVSGEYVSLTSFSFNQEYFIGGDNVEMFADFRNKGLADAENVTVELTSPSSYVTITNGNANVGTIPSLQTISLPDPLSFSISGTVTAEEVIPLIITSKTGGIIMSVDTLEIIIGIPQFVFADTTNNISELWTLFSNTNKEWETTSSEFHSPPNSYTDSKIGDYENNSDVRLTLTDPINLSEFSYPVLTFWTKFDIEDNWDYGQVEISTDNGINWEPLEGLYTNPGSSNQEPGEPLYDGTQSSWVREEMDLTGFTSNQVKVRFVLISDGWIEEDGWYVDDIGILIYTAVPVELTSFTAISSDDKVILNWSTATELNNKGFQVERALSDGKSRKLDYTKIGFVDGRGTTSEATDYNFVDQNNSTGKFSYRIKQIDYDGTFRYYGPVEVDHIGVVDYSLEQNYPNPFNPSTKINYSIPQAGFVTLKVYNVLGKEVATLVNEQKDAGRFTVEFSSEKAKVNLSSGIYFYKIQVNDFTATRKMLLVK